MKFTKNQTALLICSSCSTCNAVSHKNEIVTIEYFDGEHYKVMAKNGDIFHVDPEELQELEMNFVKGQEVQFNRITSKICLSYLHDCEVVTALIFAKGRYKVMAKNGDTFWVYPNELSEVTMNKDNLKTGMVVELKDGSKYYVSVTEKGITGMNLSSITFSDDLPGLAGMFPDCVIVNIWMPPPRAFKYISKGLTPEYLIWSAKKEMTIAEAEEALAKAGIDARIVG